MFGVMAYLLAQIAFGVWYSRRIATEDDYLVAGRSLGPVVVAFSVFATWFGAETCLAAAGETYRRGLVAATTDPLGYGVAVIVVGLAFAAPLRQRGYVTVADLFRERYGVGIERLAVVLMVPTSVLWAAAQVRAFGQVLSALSGMDPATTITIAAAVVVLYTMVGGLLADAVSDMLQGIVLVFGLGALAWAVVAAGDHAALGGLPAGRLALLPSGEPWMSHLERWAVPVVGSLVAQELISRALAAKSPEIARRGTTLGGAMFILVGMLPIALGLVGWRLLPGLEDPDQVLILQAEAYLPTVLYVVFAGALVSAILSTVDSTLLVAGSLTAHNVILSIKPDLSPRAKVRVNRGAVAFFGVVAWGLALSAESVYDLVLESAAFGTAGIFVVFAFGFRRWWGGRWAAAAALLAGSAVYQAGSWTGVLEYPYLTGLAVALAAFGLGGAVDRVVEGRAVAVA